MAAACDTYVKKKMIVKVINGAAWERKLAAFSTEFTKRRTEFEFALTIHTSVGVDLALHDIGSMDARLEGIDAKFETMLKIFAQMASPEQQAMSKCVI